MDADSVPKSRVQFRDNLNSYARVTDPNTNAMKSSKKAEKVFSQQMKLLVVGHEDAGKTSLITMLGAKLHSFKAESKIGMDSAESVEDIGQFVDTDISCTTPLSSSKPGLRDFAGLRLTPPAYGGSLSPTPRSSGSKLQSPNTYSTNSVYDLDPVSAKGYEISHWHPKKKDFDTFFFPNETGKTLFPGRHKDVKYVTWTFPGQSVNHAVHEMFLSPFALHLLVFDISKTCTERDCDIYVQYWIDLIQARAPGSSIVIVATHADLLTSAEEIDRRIDMMQTRIASNEALRLADLHRDVAYCDNEEKKANFRSLLVKRPKIDKEIIALFSISKDMGIIDLEGKMLLSCRIAQLSTPTKEVPHPFGIINIEVPYFTMLVKVVIKDLRKNHGLKFCTIKELETYILRKVDKVINLSTKTMKAVLHLSKIGEILWFDTKNDGDPAKHASDFIFLDPDWLVDRIKLILNHELIKEIAAYNFHHAQNAELKRLEYSRALAERGIIKWGFIKQYLGEKCDAEVVDVIRVVMEKFNVIIPVRPEESSLPRSQSTNSLQRAAHDGTALEKALPTSPVALSMLGPYLAASTPNLQRNFNLTYDQHYLIPTFLPPYNNEASAIAIQSGFITLERTFHFNRFTPPGIIQTIFALSYRFDEQSILPVSPQESPRAPDCWDRAFMQVHKPVRIVVELIGNDTESTSLKRPPSRGGTTPTSDSSNIAAAAEPAELKEHDFSSQLRIRGMGHMLNAHLILYLLDKYTKATRRVLDAFPGLGHVRLSSTCPECMINQRDEGKRGEFRHSELVGLQESFNKVNEALKPVRIGDATAEQHSELRQWNNKRHTCPRNRCQIKSDMLICIPKRLKAEIKHTCQSEKEINFLLDEAVRASSVPSENISSSVVKVMAANGLDSVINKLTAHFKDPMNRNSPYFDQEFIDLAVFPLEASSGVVVMPPPPKNLEFGVVDTCPAPLVLACEHVMTDVKPVDGKFQFARKGAAEYVKTVFFIGNATHWLYLAELIFQGSSIPGSDTNFWDVCALRIVAPIEPLLQSLSINSVKILNFLVLSEEEEPIILHPYFEDPPLYAMKVSTKKVAVDQVVSLLGFPGNKDLAVDCGRVEQNDPNGEILINLLSDDGSSGGPVVDRDGHLIGLLSRSHDNIKFSCVQPYRNLFDIIRALI